MEFHTSLLDYATEREFDSLEELEVAMIEFPPSGSGPVAMILQSHLKLIIGPIPFERFDS